MNDTPQVFIVISAKGLAQIFAVVVAGNIVATTIMNKLKEKKNVR